MKTLKGKTLMSILYAVILSFPMISILSRVIYVQSNKNAYQSYYGETINEKIETQIQYDELQNNETYLFSNPIATNNDVNDVGYMYVDNVKNMNGFLNNIDLSQVAKIRFYKTANYNTLQFYDINETTQIGSFGINNIQAQFTFVFKGYSENYNGYQYANYFYKVSYNKYSYLDNVFDYSVSKLVDEQNFGQLNFFQWFGNLFLNDTQSNMLYVRFVNWYLNYALLVSLMQILFLCLMWFVNFSRRLLERGMNYDW